MSPTAAATEYAESIVQDITRLVDLGAPFGLIDQDTEEWSDYAGSFADWHDNPETRWTEASALDYLQDALDIQYIVNSDKAYRAARICITLGGPTAWINTRTRQLECAWWSESVYRELPAQFCEALDGTLEDLYNC